ncbi:MAG: ornithine cyclodeaminase family protein [Planctomycetes bacterium]|nr:ornithine cyclodeaminase family protein [Planctomycetota bacterium]
MNAGRPRQNRVSESYLMYVGGSVRRDFRGHPIRYLSSSHIASLDIGMREIIPIMRDMFTAKGRGEVTMTPKVMLHPIPGEDSYITPMPAIVDMPGKRIVGMKFSAGYPQNVARGLPYIDSEIILKDPDTGRTYAVLGGNWITGARTGAATAVAADLFARKGEIRVGVISAGLQARTNLIALDGVRDITEARVFDPDHRKRSEFVTQMSEFLSFPITPVDEVDGAVRDCDVVVTAAPIRKQPGPIERDWLKPGAFVSALDFDASLSRDVLRRPGVKLITDDAPQLDSKRHEGFFANTPPIEVEVGDVLAGTRRLDAAPDDVVVFLNLGIAPSDLVVAQLAFERAEQASIGIELRPLGRPSWVARVLGLRFAFRLMRGLRRLIVGA